MWWTHSTYQEAELVSPLCKLRFEKRELTQKESVDLDQLGVQQRKVGDRLGCGLALSSRVVTLQKKRPGETTAESKTHQQALDESNLARQRGQKLV